MSGMVADPVWIAVAAAGLSAVFALLGFIAAGRAAAEARLQTARFEALDRLVREEFVRSRLEAEESARRLREEVAARIDGLSGGLHRQTQEMARQQKDQGISPSAAWSASLR